ncbi:36789_t:CDS:2, partial [Gigaspora margarita]
ALLLVNINMPRISIKRKSRIHALICEGYPSRYVAKKENVSQSSVRDKRNTIRLLASGNCSNAVEIQKIIKIGHKIETSESTLKDWSVEDWY